jgi:flagellar basal body-associated protein FliL
MPEQAPSVAGQDALPDQSVPAGRTSSLVSKLSVVLLLTAVVVVECAIAYLCIPSPSQTAAMAGVTLPPDAGADAGLWPEQPSEEAAKDLEEVDLGEFTVTAFQPISNTTLRIDFHLYGTVDADEKADFEKAWEENMHRVRDQVITTVRSCELAELTEAGLGLIKRKILEKTNRTFGEPLLQTVIFSDFSFIEQ